MSTLTRPAHLVGPVCPMVGATALLTGALSLLAWLAWLTTPAPAAAPVQVAPAQATASARPTASVPVTTPAHVARTISLNETGRLHLTSRHNFTLNEQGSASGTVPGTIYVHLTAVSSSRVVAEVNIYPRGGSLSGHGSGSYRRAGATASFSGAMAIGHGSGDYARAHGAGLSFSGTIDESSDDAITVHVNGTVSD